jgi:hypothetical protein
MTGKADADRVIVAELFDSVPLVRARIAVRSAATINHTRKEWREREKGRERNEFT